MRAIVVVAVLAALAVRAAAGPGPIQMPPTERPVAAFGCAALPPSPKPTITVGPDEAARLAAIVHSAPTGTTILLKDGTYRLGATRLTFDHPGVSLRSISNEAAKVVLDGEYRSDELVAIAASDVLVAHVTLTRAVDHLVHIVPAGDATVRNPRLYGVRLVDAGEQFVKVNPNGGRAGFVDAGRIECSVFSLTIAGRARVETLGGTSCYTGGIDVHGGRDWVVRLNRFENIFCQTGRLAEHAVHFWQGSRGTLVENNTIVNCARGIGFGLGPSGQSRRDPEDARPASGYVGHDGGLIRNNVIYADRPEYDTGIGLEQARDVRVFHNTVFATRAATGAFASIDTRFGSTRAEIRNNLVNNITNRQGATTFASHNAMDVTAAAFVDAAAGDFHLRESFMAAIDRGMLLADAGLDIDGQPHGARPDIGADERTPVLAMAADTAWVGRPGQATAPRTGRQ